MTDSTKDPGELKEHSVSTKTVSFWRLVRDLGLKRTVKSWDFIGAMLLSTLFAMLAIYYLPVTSYSNVAGDLLSIAASLYGVIIAGFAIVAALLGDRYSALLRASHTSPLRILQHFLLIAGLLVGSVISSLTFKYANPLLAMSHKLTDDVFLGVTLFLFFWGLFYTIELIKLVLTVALTSVQFNTLTSTEQTRNKDHNA